MARRRTLQMALALLACGVASPAGARAELEGIHKVQHVIVILQENRSFDTYFGTYPGANGIPHGVCVPDPEAAAVSESGVPSSGQKRVP